MAQDKKYGKVTFERGSVGEDEPVVVFRGADALITYVMMAYVRMCTEVGSPQGHVDLVRERIGELFDWQASHGDEVRIPASSTYLNQIQFLQEDETR